MAERGRLYLLVAWIVATFMATVLLRPLLEFLSGGRTIIDAKTVRSLRVLVLCACLIGVYYLWKLP